MNGQGNYFSAIPPISEWNNDPVCQDLLSSKHIHIESDADSCIVTMKDWRLLRRLGQGGVGIVFQAVRMHDQELVAIKILNPKFTEIEKIRQLFIRGALWQKELHHRRILRIRDVEENFEIPFFVMDYKDGGDLGGLITKRGPLSRPFILELFRPLVEALVYIHENGRIHLDIKPANIILSAALEPFLADFDFIHPLLAEDYEDIFREIECGTVHFSPPGTDLEGFGRDIYSMGAVLYSMLSGKVPYDSVKSKDVPIVKLTEDPVPIREINPEADDDLIRVAETAMRRERRNRYNTIRDMNDDLVLISSGFPPRGSIRFSPVAGIDTDVSLPEPRSAVSWMTGRFGLALVMLVSALVMAGAFIWNSRPARPDVSADDGGIPGDSPAPETPVIAGTGSAMFEQRELYQKYSIKDVPLGPRLSYVGDVDNDGLMELIIGSGQNANNPGMITVYKFQDAAFVEIFRATNNNLFVGGITVGDITNDGKNELIVGWGQPDFPGDITVYKRKSEGIGLYWKGFRYHGGQHALCVGDSNNDGRNELVVGLDYRGRAVYVLKFYQDSEGEFKEEIEWFFQDSDVLSVDVCDSNENGINELLVGGGPYDWYDARIFEHVPGTSEYREIWRSPKIGRTQAFCLDLDADGKQEIVIGDGGYDYGDNGLWVYQWNGFEYIRTMIASDKRSSFPGGCGSLFGDGIPQFAITNIDPGNPVGNSGVKLYEIQSGGLKPVWNWEGYSGPFSPGIGDVDNDKHNELIIYDRSDPENVSLRIFAGVGK